MAWLQIPVLALTIWIFVETGNGFTAVVSWLLLQAVAGVIYLLIRAPLLTLVGLLIGIALIDDD